MAPKPNRAPSMPNRCASTQEVAERNASIKAWYQAGYTQPEIAEAFGVTQPYVSQIVNNPLAEYFEVAA